jgi:deoxyribodipyrimidine photo-lyase
MHEINEKRVRLLQKGIEQKGPVVYWMSRDQRVHDNWALLFAQNQALQNSNPLIVVFCLLSNFLGATFCQYGFMLKGLKEVEKELSKYNIPFFLLTGTPEIEIPKFISEKKACKLIADFDPLKIKRIWKRDVARKINIPFFEVDAHNIVPSLYISDKEEYGAYTLRPKIFKSLPEFLVEYPQINKMNKLESLDGGTIDWAKVEASLKIDREVKEVDWIKPGSKNAIDALEYFLNNNFDLYNKFRNDPALEGQSNLSPYLHFGQISAQRIVLQIQKINGNKESETSFLEELIVRRELSDNFCYFNKNYNTFNGFKNWAKETLINHKNDKREFNYTLEQFENAETHEDLWNAAQIQMVKTGKMHGYMRMYWAKKILEWSDNPANALKTAIYLNDKYELDGRDPNGYAGCAWSIGGIHDRAWAERPVFGKIRYMNRNGAKRKFNIDKYISNFKKI